MKRTFLAALLAIAVLFGGSMTFVFLMTGRSGSPGSPANAPVEDAPPPLAAPVVTAPPSRAAPAAGPERMHASAWSSTAEAPASAPTASRVIRKIVRKALLEAPVQSRLARCTDQFGGFGGAAAPGPIPRGTPATLMLELEALGSEVRIVDTSVREWGSASEPMVSCARSVLKGQVIPASTERQERLQMPFPLNPRSQVVASSR